MVYLILSSGFSDSSSDPYIKLLKIGYTEDSCSEKRFATYKLHNPTMKILYTIPGGTVQDETNLQYYFKKFLFPGYGREWFLYDDEIVEYFKTHTNVDSLFELNNVVKGMGNMNPAFYKKLKKLINRWFCIDSETTQKLNIKDIIKYFHDNFREYSDELKLYQYLKNNYNVSDDVIENIDNFLKNNIENPKEAIIFLRDFENLPGFKEKMKAICECPISDQERIIILDQVPIQYKNFYNTLGPSRCKALSYNITNISKEYNDMLFDKDKLDNEIFDTFKIGNRYTRSYVKDILKDIYINFGYNRSAKASDLEDYFEIKDVLLTEDGLKMRGYQIISKKQL